MTARVRVDLMTRFLSDNIRCYIMFPGSGYRYYTSMKETGFVFLDVPGFPFKQDEDIGDADDLVARVVVSERIRQWYREGAGEDALPPRTVSELSNFKETSARRQLAGLVRNFVKRVKVNDLFVVPPKHYTDDVLFGEIEEDDVHLVDHPEISGEKVPAKKVRWIKRIERRRVPGWLERKIASPNPLRQIEREWFQSLFDIVYERYVYDGVYACKFSVSAHDFSSVDNYRLQRLFLFSSGAFALPRDSLQSLPFSEIVDRAAETEDMPDQRIAISSPGHMVLYKKSLVPIVAAALISTALISGAGDSIAQTPTVEIVNSADDSEAADLCNVDVAAEVNGELQAMGFTKWQELCMIAARSRIRAGVDTRMPTSIEGGDAVREEE